MLVSSHILLLKYMLSFSISFFLVIKGCKLTDVLNGFSSIMVSRKPKKPTNKECVLKWISSHFSLMSRFEDKKYQGNRDGDHGGILIFFSSQENDHILRE